jgi:hypothetical protein
MNVKLRRQFLLEVDKHIPNLFIQTEINKYPIYQDFGKLLEGQHKSLDNFNKEIKDSKKHFKNFVRATDRNEDDCEFYIKKMTRLGY